MPDMIAPGVLSWASILDPQTAEQAANLGRLPIIHRHVALMPDAHLGKGSTVGSVIPTEGAIIPAAVGVDIGCGMMAVRTSFTKQDLTAPSKSLANLRMMIESQIPLGPGKANDGMWDAGTERRVFDLHAKAEEAGFDPHDYTQRWDLQLGTLGGGNHFIEIVSDEKDRVWVFLHSGSRGVGNRIAQRHIKVARDQHARRRTLSYLPDPDLAWLTEGETEFWHYIREMRWAQEFAWTNREEMMDRCLLALRAFLGDDTSPFVEETIHCHHNYTVQERHFDRPVWVTRKGAIRAGTGDLGLIPGSMGAASYVVRGLGNPASFLSAPHGAGRVYSRTEARKRFGLEGLQLKMAGIEWSGNSAFLDEDPDAYKSIDQVMADASSLVEVVHTFRQLVNVKGQ